VHIKHLRPLPPPTPEGLIAGAKRGKALELRCDIYVLNIHVYMYIYLYICVCVCKSG